MQDKICNMEDKMSSKDKITIIPEVLRYTQNDSFFTLTEKSEIGVSSEALIEKGNLFKGYLTTATGFPLSVSVNSNRDISLVLEGKEKTDHNGFVDERYTIEVIETQCIIKSATVEGIARAIQTFRQLLPAEIFSEKQESAAKWTIPCCSIEDIPRFKWRGMHLDVCRHFMKKEDVLKFIDLIALYKYNRFHFHLTEDQGWRIEIKKYPKLTEIGGYRDSTLIGHSNDQPKKYDDKEHGGFYTQEEIKEIVAFAAEREIVIIPEIDMPGHMQAAISAYPELGCTNASLKPLCHWGISQHILNVEDTTVSFMKDVLDEVMELFPGQYIHIGGDEAPKYEWEEEKRIQDRMIELSVNSYDELQSWFIKQIASHIQSKERKVIGWDEILEGGLAEGAAVMSWQGEEGGLKAANLGHDVVMTPRLYVYFDNYQGDKESESLAIGGFTPLEKVYEYEPVPKEMPEDQHRLVMGSQGQLWTEYMPDFNHVEYMMFPRTCALSEVLWTEKFKKNYSNFLEKMENHNRILDFLKVNRRK